MHNDKELHLTCGCHSHEFHIEKDCAGDYSIWYGSFWLRGYPGIGKRSFKYTLKLLWRVLKYGDSGVDDIVFYREHLEELLVYIQEQLNKDKK